MAKPTYIVEWCVEEFDSNGVLSRVEPPPENQLTGLLPDEAVFRLWFNELNYNFSQNIKYLANERDPVGAVRSVETGTFASDAEASAQYSGTWVTEGTDTLAGLGITVYKKTAL